MCYLHHSTAKPSDDRNSFSGPRSASPSTPDPVPLPGSLGSKPNKATNRENHNEFLCFVAAGRELRWSVGLLQGRVVLLLLAALAGLVVLVGVKVPAAKWHRWLIVSIRSLFFLVEHHAPERDGVTGAEGRLDFVRIAPVRPEEDEPVEDGLDVGHLIRPALREDAQQATVLLFKKKKEPKKHWDHTILAFSTRRNWIRIRTKSNGIKAQGLDGFQNRRLFSISKPPSQKVHHQRVRPGRGAYLPPLRCMAGT